MRRATHYAREAAAYNKVDGNKLVRVVQEAAQYHDLGKLDAANQAVLRDSSLHYSRLPVNHVDAGAAALKQRDNFYAAFLVYAHHRGFPNLVDEIIRSSDLRLRDDHKKTRDHVNELLAELLTNHKEALANSDNLEEDAESPDDPITGDSAVFLRMALSCLADADHSDTAKSYGQYPAEETLPSLRAQERLVSLDRYVQGLGGDGKRSALRQQVYDTCRNKQAKTQFSTCDSPVGSGKTTAVMAHLLQQAVAQNARRIIVVLPFTNIISQSVDVYRKALVLPGEDPEQVVGELHHLADFQDKDTRYLTALWRSPIIVTTAVAFFETLASQQPSRLRKFHELPGSMVFLDEAHAAMPLKLYPLAWQWMNALANEWDCYWVLASGSLVRFWDLSSIDELAMPKPKVADLVDDQLKEDLALYEGNRIKFYAKDKPLSINGLVNWVSSMPGPRLLILNTVQNAAVIAHEFAKRFGREKVEHLSTALTPKDRSRVVKQVSKRLGNEEDKDWTLIATSCVEAGVDFSFRTGFREVSSALSLLQTGGRVNRHGAYDAAELWSFKMRDDSRLTKNPTLMTAQNVLTRLFAKKVSITPELSTEVINDEIRYNDYIIEEMSKLLEQEKIQNFKTVAEKFKVIDSDDVLALVDIDVVDMLKDNVFNWRVLQQNSVSVRKTKVVPWKLELLAKGLYRWVLNYDSFLGYMRGVLEIGRNERSC